MKLPSILVLLMCSLALNAQDTSKDTLSLKRGISKPNITPVHPFGMFSMRLSQNFRTHAQKGLSIDLTTSSGNVWSEPVTTYLPTSTTERDRLSDIIFFSRQFFFDPEVEPAKVYELSLDAVLKDIRLEAIIGIADRQELRVGLRANLVTKGKFPFTIFSGDEFIEFFHSNIAGGEDPFARRSYGLNKANISYTDRNGNTMNLGQGDFILSGIETSYFYYPSFLTNERQNFFMNFGVHLGGNLSKYNTSVDMALSSSAIKSLTWRDKNTFSIGLGSSLLRKNLVTFNNDLDLGTNKYIFNIEGHLEYAKRSASGATNSIGLNYMLQTSYHKRNEFDYAVLVGVRRQVTWHHGASHLYDPLSYWTLIYTFTKKWNFSFYLQQDFEVNNAPDIQSGIRLGIPIN